MRKATLLRSVSAIATAAASAGGAHQALAQDTGSEGYYYNVQGGFLWSPAETYLAGIEDKMGSGMSGYSGSAYYSASDFADLFGGNASISLGKQLDPNWDVRGTASITQFGETTASFSGSGSFSGYMSGYSGESSYTNTSSYFRADYDLWSEGSYSFGWQALDLEIGYSPVLSDNFSVRLFAGIRGLHFSESSNYTSGFQIGVSGYDYSGAYYSGFSSYFSSTFSGMSQSDFYGIGPRIGAQTSKRFEGTNFGLSASVAGAVLFGTQKTTWEGAGNFYSSYSAYGGSAGSAWAGTSGSGYSSSSYSSSTEVDKMVLDIQGQIGLDYYLDDANKLTVGVQAEKLFNVGPYDDNDVTRSSAGVFVGLTGSF